MHVVPVLLLRFAAVIHGLHAGWRNRSVDLVAGGQRGAQGATVAFSTTTVARASPPRSRACRLERHPGPPGRAGAPRRSGSPPSTRAAEVWAYRGLDAF